MGSRDARLEDPRNVVLLREGDDAVFSTAHAQQMQTARPTRRSVQLEPGELAERSTALLHGTVSAAGRAAFSARLGTGGTASVWLHATSASGHVAVKVIARHTRRQRALADALRRKARAAGLPHPSVVRVFDQGTADGRTYLVMECFRSVACQSFWPAVRP